MPTHHYWSAWAEQSWLWLLIPACCSNAPCREQVKYVSPWQLCGKPCSSLQLLASAWFTFRHCKNLESDSEEQVDNLSVCLLLYQMKRIFYKHILWRNHCQKGQGRSDKKQSLMFICFKTIPARIGSKVKGFSK